MHFSSRNLRNSRSLVHTDFFKERNKRNKQIHFFHLPQNFIKYICIVKIQSLSDDIRVIADVEAMGQVIVTPGVTVVEVGVICVGLRAVGCTGDEQIVITITVALLVLI